MEIVKNDEYTLLIDSYTSEGSGVGRIQGYPVFVPDTVRGDIVKVKIVKVLKSYAYGKCINIITPSEERVVPSCKHYKECGGCAIMNLSQKERAYFKKEKVKNAFLHIAGIEVSVEQTECAEEIGYRNKNQMPVCDDYTQAMYKNRTNEKVSVPHCVIQDEKSKKVCEYVLSFLKDKKILPYDALTKKGVVRHIYTRVSSLTGQILLTIIATKKINLYEMKDELEKLNVSGLVLNLNKSETNKILGNESITIFGDNYIKDRLCGTDFLIYPDSFFQVNKFLTERLYNKVVKLASLTGKETVFDLYCGAGTITAALSKHAKEVYGIEIVPSAVSSAKESMKRAGITNVKIYEGESEKVAPRLIKEGIKADCIVVDPPRKGCAESLLKALCEMKSKRIVYVSCDCATLARDVKYLTQNGYTLKKVYPFDMFPFTHHVETVVLLCREG